MAEEWDGFIGCRANFRTKVDDLLHSGYIQNIDKESRRITFYNVTVKETGKDKEKVFGGLQHFHIDDIYDLDITDEVNTALRNACLKKEVHRNFKTEKNIRHNKDTPRHLLGMNNWDPKRLMMQDRVDKEMERTEDESGNYESILPEDCTLLDDCKNQLFKDAIAHLKQQHTLGVTFEGIQIGRSGELCWILISTAEHTMFFDIKTMGEECFEAGIREVLESPDIMKVIHDCRRPSDHLHHQYGAKLVNIFDTQVAAVFIYRLHHQNDFPRYVSNLADCLRNDLEIDAEDIHFPLVASHCPEKDEKVWSYRPAPTIVYSWMLKHCRHLLALQDKQMAEMLTEFTMGVDIYLQNLRDVNKSDAKMRMECQHLLPTDFVGLHAQVQAVLRERQLRKKRVSRKYVGAAQKDGLGMHENCTGILHPQVVGNHDTIWHTASHHMNFHAVKRSSPQGNPWARRKKCSSDSEMAREGGHSRQESHRRRYTSGTKSAVDSCGSDVELIKPRPPAASTSAEAGATQPATGARVSDLPVSAESASSPISSAAADTARRQSVAEKEGSGLRGYGETLAMLRQTRKQQEKEKAGAPDLHPKQIVFRPAGQSVHSVPKKLEREGERATNSKDLAGRGFQPCTPAGNLTGSEFDLIPSQEELEEKYRSKEPSSGNMPVFVPADSPPTVDGEGGFKIDRFTETVPPPPFSGPSGNDGALPANKALAATLPRVESQSMPGPVSQFLSTCLRSQAEGTTGWGADFDDGLDDCFGPFAELNGTGDPFTASGALAAILPCVENPSQLRSGSRSSSRQPLPGPLQANGARGLQVNRDKSDAKPPIANCLSSVASGTFVGSSHKLARSKSPSPAGGDSSAAAAASSTDTAAGRRKSAYFLQQARHSAASESPSVVPVAAESSVSAAAVNSCEGALNSGTPSGSTKPVHSSHTAAESSVSSVAVNSYEGALNSGTLGGSTEPVCFSRTSPTADSGFVSGAECSQSRPVAQSPPAASASQAGSRTGAPTKPPVPTSAVDAPTSQSGPGPAGGKSLLAMLGITLTPQERTMKFAKAAGAKV